MPKDRLVKAIDLQRAARSAVSTPYTGTTGDVIVSMDHGSLTGLTRDDHLHYLNISRANTWGDAKYVPLGRTVTAGNGLTGGGALTGNITLSLTLPGNLSASSQNVASGSHTHAVLATSAATAGAESLLKSDSSGSVGAVNFISTGFVRTPTLTSSTTITLDAVGDAVLLGSANIIKSDHYTSQSTGWGITYGGSADFRYLYTDELHAKALIADLQQALAGGQIIAKSVAIVYQAFTLPTAGNSATFIVRDLPGTSNMATFVNGDWVLFQGFSRSAGSLNIGRAWGTVVLDTTYGVNGFDSATATQRYTFTRSTNYPGSLSGNILADAIVLDYGTTGNGTYEVNAIDGAYSENSPYAQVQTWTVEPGSTAPGQGRQTRLRIGNLKGITGSAEYGLWAGDTAKGNVKVTGDAVQLRQGTDAVISLNNDGSSRFDGPMALGTGGGIYQGSGTFASPTTGLKIWNDSGTGRIGGYNGGTIQWYGDTNGKLSFAEGQGRLDATGIRLANGTNIIDTRMAYGFGLSALTGGIGAYTDTYNIANTVQMWTQGTGNSENISLYLHAINSGSSSETFASFLVNDNERIRMDASGVKISGTLAVPTTTLTGTEPYLYVGSAQVSTGACIIRLGTGRTDDGVARIDLQGDTYYSDYGLRVNRNGGQNGVSSISHRGTGQFLIRTVDTAALNFATADTTRMSVEAAGNVDVVNELRAKLIRLDSSGTQSGVANTITFTNETYLGSLSNSDGNIKMVNATPRSNVAWLKMYVGVDVYWLPLWSAV